MANITSEKQIDGFSAGVTLAVISTISLMSNILLVVVIGKRLKSRLQHSERFLTLYGCLEGTYASVPAVLSTVSYLSHQWSVNANEVICDFHGWISFATKCSCVVVTTSLLLERYLEKSRLERNWRQILKRLFHVSVCGVVASGLLAAVPVIAGHKMASFEPTGSYCHFDYNITTSMSRAYSISIVIIGYILLQAGFFCYISLCCERRRKGRDKTQLLGFHSEINGNILNHVTDSKSPQQRTKERGGRVTRGDDVQPWQQSETSFTATVLDETSFTATVLAVVTIQWLCYLPFLIVIVMALTGYDVTSELDFAVVRMLSIEGALNPLIVLWSFPPYRLIIKILLCGRCSNGGGKKKQTEGLYEPEPKHVSQSVVYDSTLDDAPSWYLSRPSRSLPKSYSTGDLISHSLEDSTKGRHHRASVRSILIPSKSSEFLPSPPHRYLEKPRRSIHWEDDVLGYPGIKGDMSKVILVRQGADGVRAGGESICYVNEEDSYSSEMSSHSDDWTTDSDEDPLPVYIINGKAYYIASLHQNDGNKRCALCDCKDDADQDERTFAVQENHQRASNSAEENGRVRGRAEQRAARCDHPAAVTPNALERKVTLSVRPKSTKPRVLRKQVERLKRLKDARGEMREQSEIKEVAVIADLDFPQVYDRNLEHSANMNSSRNVDIFSQDTIHGESASNLPLEFYQHERNATNPVFINDEQRNVYHPENHIAQCVGSRQHGAVETLSLDQGYSRHDHPDIGAIKEDEDEVLGLGCRQHQGTVETIDQSYPLHDHPDLGPIREDEKKVLGQGGAVQDRLSDLKKTPQKSVPYEVENTDYTEVSPEMLHHNVVLIGAETGQKGTHVIAEIPHLGRGMDSLKHLEIHCEQLLQRSLSFRNDIDRECEKTKEVVTTTETSNITDGKHTFVEKPRGSQQVPSQTVADTPIQLNKTDSHVVSNRKITSKNLRPRDEHTLLQGAVANDWNSSINVCTNEANYKTKVSTDQSNRRTIQDRKGTDGNFDKNFPSYINAPRCITRSNGYEISCGHVSKEDIQVLHHLPAAGEAQIMTENHHRIFKKEPQDESVSANSVPINMTYDRYDVIDDRTANYSVSIGTQLVHHHKNQYNTEYGGMEESNTKIETPVASQVNSGSVSDIPLIRGDGTRNVSSQPSDQKRANGLRSGETDMGRGFNKPRVSDPPLEKDIVFHGLTSEDPQVINLLFQKVIMRPEQPAREEPLCEAVARAADGEPVVGKLDGPKVTLKTRDNFQQKSNMHVAGENVSHQMAVNVRNYHSYSETTTASSNVEQPGGDVEGSPSGDITYRHFLRAINLTPAKKQPDTEKTTVPSFSVTPSDNNVNCASEIDDSMSSDSSVASLFCKPPMLGSKRRKGKHNLTIPYWLNVGSGSSHTNDDQSNDDQVGNVGKPSNNNSEIMPNLLENKLSGIHYFECEESNDNCHQRKTTHGTDDKLPAQPKDVDFQLVPDSVNRSRNVNTDSTIKRDNTRLGFQQTHKDFDETKGINSSTELPLTNKSSKQDINASKSTETYTDQNLHSRAETTSYPSHTNPAAKRRRSHSLDTSGFLDFTPATQITNNHRNENVLVTETKVTNERARRTSLPQHMLSQSIRPFAKSEIL